MNVYKKLAGARVLLQQRVGRKSGINKHYGFNYFELGDFLPQINEINEEVGIVSIISFTEGLATLEIVDVEDHSKVVFTTPTSKLALKNASEPQQIGAMHTFFRRYLYILSYEICEHDMIDIAPQEESVSDEEIAQAIQSLSTATDADDLTVKHVALTESVRYHSEVVEFFNSKAEKFKNKPVVNVSKLIMGNTPMNLGAHPSTMQLPLEKV